MVIWDDCLPSSVLWIWTNALWISDLFGVIFFLKPKSAKKNPQSTIVGGCLFLTIFMEPYSLHQNIHSIKSPDTAINSAFKTTSLDENTQNIVTLIAFLMNCSEGKPSLNWIWEFVSLNRNHYLWEPLLTGLISKM